MENERKDRTSVPQKYGMVSCPRCNGLGKVFRSVKEIEVCMACGGFGAIKAPEEKLVHTHRMMKYWKNGILD